MRQACVKNPSNKTKQNTLKLTNQKKTKKIKKTKKNFFFCAGKFEDLAASGGSTLLLSFKMNTFAYQRLYPFSVLAPPQTNLDWLELPWGGPYPEEEEDFPIALCGSWECPGNCNICVAAEEAMQRIFLPIQGPVNRDGIPLGFLLVTP